MTVKPPPRKKPSSADEIARVLRIYDVLSDEIKRRSHGPDRGLTLEVAERIAARTED